MAAPYGVAAAVAQKSPGDSAQGIQRMRYRPYYLAEVTQIGMMMH
jgi:hypothetical protein